MGDKARSRRRKHQFEYWAVRFVILVVRSLPLAFLRFFGTVAGDAFFALSERRRQIALANLRHALGESTGEEERKDIARESCRSLILTFLEMIRFHFSEPDMKTIRERTARSQHLQTILTRARHIHDETGGCLFVTPHIGNWELLLRGATLVGIPLAVVMRPLDNPDVERLLFATRAAEGHLVIPKKNALFALQRILRQGKSIGLLPDQSTKKGIPASFFGRKALTTPVPALLSVMYNRPIVVVACCRSRKNGTFEGFVSDPLWPTPGANERDEVVRLTQAMNHSMEEVIVRYPEQYLWIHNRWKTYDR